MADDLPYMKFFPADFLADCDVLSVGARGAWHTFLCKAWLARSASISLKPAQWSRVFGATNVEQAERLIAEIEECEVGDVIRDESGRVALVSRRIERDLKEMGATAKKKSNAARIAAEARWNKERMRDACDAHPGGNADAMREDAIPEARSQKPESVSNDTSTASTSGKPESKQMISWDPENGWQGITEKDREEWALAYPACDIPRQLAVMHQWLLSNPSKARKKAWRRFVTNWLSRNQESGGDLRGRTETPAIKRDDIGGRTMSVVKVSELPKTERTEDDDYQDSIPL